MIGDAVRVIEEKMMGPIGDVAFDCQECGQRVTGAGFHPYLYCLLYKNGVRDQETYLRESGFVREAMAR